MNTERPGPLQVGQVLEGLLEDVGEPPEGAATAQAEPLAAAPSEPDARLPVALWERMMAAVDQKFDGDEDGDTRGEG